MSMKNSVMRFFTEGRTARFRTAYIVGFVAVSAAALAIYYQRPSQDLVFVVGFAALLLAGVTFPLLAEAIRRMFVHFNAQGIPEDLTRDVDNQAADIRALWREVDKLSETRGAGDAATRKRVEEVRNELLIAVDGKVDMVDGKVDMVDGKVDALDERLGGVEGQSRPAATAVALWGPEGPPHLRVMSRVLSSDDEQILLDQWAQQLGVRITGRELSYLAHRVRVIESNGIGRLATPVQAALIRIVCARSTPKEEISILEIGTLFGLGAAVVSDGIRGFFRKIAITLIDPLSGYYGQGSPDIITGAMPVKEAANTNLAMVGLDPEAVQFVLAKSTESSVRQSLEGRSYDFLIIDGDHSSMGVSSDFDWYAPLVAKRGLILFDDYGNKDWPAVTQFVDSEVMERSELQLVATGFNTAVFRVLEPLSPAASGSADVSDVE